jgi:hypothetical protein
MNLCAEGKKVAGKLVHKAILTPICKAWKSLKDKQDVHAYTDDESLCLLIDGNLMNQQYQLIRSQTKDRNADIYPSYHQSVAIQGKNAYQS